MTDPVASATAARVTAAEVAAWEDPPRAVRSDGAPVLAVEGFAGPLDWLLELARAKKLDLAKLSIAALIEAFATAMQAGLAGRDTDRIGHWAVWTVMAATLTELWSRLLLPANSPEAKAAQAEAEALRQQLLNRARMRSAADWLERRPQWRRELYGKTAWSGFYHDPDTRRNSVYSALIHDHFDDFRLLGKRVKRRAYCSITVLGGSR